MAEEVQKTDTAIAGAAVHADAPSVTVAAPATPAELKHLLEERKELNARIRAAKIKARGEARTLRNRLGILTGLAVLDWLEANPTPALAEQVQRARDRFLTRPDERALFGLPPKLELVTPRRRKAKPETGAANNSAGVSPAPSDTSGNAPAPQSETRQNEDA